MSSFDNYRSDLVLDFTGKGFPASLAAVRARASIASASRDFFANIIRTTLGESGFEKLAECNLEGGEQQCTIFIKYNLGGASLGTN